MENTLENKAKFFALYWSQLVLMQTDGYGVKKCIQAYWEKSLSTRYLELKPLSSISDEDALEVANLLGNSSHLSEYSKIYQAKDLISNNNFFNKQTNITANQWLKVFDFLRSRGYALPWMGLSVEQLINYGWIKLKK